MALFDGVQNFTPAFTGQQLAIQAGQGAGQSISRGMQTAQRSKAQALDEKQFKFQSDNYPQEFSLRQKSEQVRENELRFRQQQWEFSHQMNKLNGLMDYLGEGMPD